MKSPTATILTAAALSLQGVIGATIAPTFFCNTDLQGWISGHVSDLTDMTNAANSAISTLCAGGNPSLCKTTGSSTTCTVTVGITHCTGCSMLASYEFSSATPPASCTNDLQFIAANCIETGNTLGTLNTANGTITYTLDADVF